MHSLDCQKKTTYLHNNRTDRISLKKDNWAVEVIYKDLMIEDRLNNYGNLNLKAKGREADQNEHEMKISGIITKHRQINL